MTTPDGLINEQNHTFKIRFENTGNVRERVILHAQPDFTETRRVNYNAVEPVHGPGAIQVFKNAAARTFTFGNARFISRTPEEATRNMRYLHLLKSWVMPRFGEMGSEHIQTQAAANPQSGPYTHVPAGLGHPPPVLYLSAFSNHIPTTDGRGAKNNNQQTNIFRVPIVLGNVTINYLSDTTMIQTLGPNPEPFPTILTIDLEAMETHSPSEYSRFNLRDYKQGRLEHF